MFEETVSTFDRKNRNPRVFFPLIFRENEQTMDCVLQYPDPKLPNQWQAIPDLHHV